MKKIAMLLFAAIIPCAFGQNAVRFDSNNTISAKNVPSGAQAPVYTLPFSKVTVCGYPAVPESGSTCTNTMPIYSDQAMTKPIQQPLIADSQGRYGYWVPPALYSESIATSTGTYVGTWARYLNFSPGGSGQFSSVISKSPRVDVRHPDFGVGRPVAGVALTGGSGCTAFNGITGMQIAISAPDLAPGVQATVNQTYVDASGVPTFAQMANRGAGYGSATATVTGCAVNPTAVVTLSSCTPGPADPTGVNDSACAIQQAADYAQTVSGTLGSFPDVYIPNGTYKTNSTIYISSSIGGFGGDQMGSTIIITNTGKKPMFELFRQLSGTVTGPDNWIGNFHMHDFSVVGQGDSSRGVAFEVIGGVGNHFENLNIYNCGCLGINWNGTGVGPERSNIENIIFSEVRWPMVVLQNETRIQNIRIANPAVATTPAVGSNQYTYGPNAINGVTVALNWGAGGTLVAASNDSVGNATFTVAATQVPIVAGMWFHVNTPDQPQMTGDWQATNTPVLSGGQFTVTAQLYTGGFRSYGPNAASIINVGSTPYSGAAGVSSIPAGSTWQPKIWPFNMGAIYFGHTEQSSLDGGSLKVTSWMGGIQDVQANNLAVSNFYIESAAIPPGMNPSIMVGGYLPYTYLTSGFADTGCSNGHLCSGAVTPGSIWFPNTASDPTDNVDVVTQAAAIEISCWDYTTASTAPSACGNGLLQNQYEEVQGSIGTDDVFRANSRNISGSTAPANYAWPAGARLGYIFRGALWGNSLTPATSYKNMHDNAISIALPAGYSPACLDAGATPCAQAIVGAVADGVENPFLGTAGLNFPPASVSFENSFFATAATCLNSTATYYGCIKVIGRGIVNFSGNNSPGPPVGEQSIAASDGTVLGSASYGIIGVKNGNFASQVVVNDETTRTNVYQPGGTSINGRYLSEFTGGTVNSFTNIGTSPGLSVTSGLQYATSKCDYDTSGFSALATSFSISGNVLTIIAPNMFAAGETIMLRNFTNTYLNANLNATASILTVLASGLSSTQFSVNFTHADVASTTDTGTAFSTHAGGAFCVTGGPVMGNTGIGWQQQVWDGTRWNNGPSSKANNTRNGFNFSIPLNSTETVGGVFNLGNTSSFEINASQGTAGQVPMSQGPGLPLKWGTAAGGGSGVTASGTSCTITSITNGLITGAHCP